MVLLIELVGVGVVVVNFIDCVFDWLWIKIELIWVGFCVCGKVWFVIKIVCVIEVNLFLVLFCLLVFFSLLLGFVNVFLFEVKKKVVFFWGFFVVKEFFFIFFIMIEMKGGLISLLCILG